MANSVKVARSASTGVLRLKRPRSSAKVLARTRVVSDWTWISHLGVVILDNESALSWVTKCFSPSRGSDES